ncbi:MAG: hypothetical protein OXG72_05160 [Acidobacteria bacterium]|nr:hypothetical protein [Acidobacteriota bacterium]
MVPHATVCKAAAALFVALTGTNTIAAEPSDVILGQVAENFSHPLRDSAVEAISPSGYSETAHTGTADAYELPRLYDRLRYARDR